MIKRLNDEMTKITLAELEGKSVDFSKLREIYAKTAMVFADDFPDLQYNPEDSDDVLWNKCKTFSKRLVELSK